MINKLLSSWPAIARHVVLDAARYYYREMNEPFPVPYAIMEQAIALANRELEIHQKEIYEEASPRWINRWERGTLDAEMRKAIEGTYDRLRRAERPIRAPVKSRSAQLDANIAHALRRR